MNKEGKGARQDLRDRLNDYAIRVVRMFTSLKKNDVATQVLGKQALRSGTSAGAHYREACRARSSAEFISKIEGALQDLDETDYWMNLIVHSGAVSPEGMQELINETNELISIFTTIAKKAKGGTK